MAHRKLHIFLFQLYWNKMDGAYNSLNNIFSTLIQTSAAAERVFSLLECNSDIESTPRLKETDSWGREVEELSRQTTLQKVIPSKYVYEMH